MSTECTDRTSRSTRLNRGPQFAERRGGAGEIRGADVRVSVPGGEEFEETFLTIQELPGRKLVTVIEVLLPTNKKTKGRQG